MDPIPVSCEIDEGDFVGGDGLLRCGKCGAGKQVRVDWGGQTAIMPVMCRCQVEEADRLDAARRAAAHVRSVEGSPSHKLCLPLDPGHEFGLGRDDRRGFRVVREYARHWEQMEEGGHGLVLIGPPGTGLRRGLSGQLRDARRQGAARDQRLPGGKRALGRQGR